jgi:hypothetical protein
MTVATATITDLGFTSNGKRLYHVLVGAGDSAEPVNIPCMQILATVPTAVFTENVLTVTVDTAYLVVAA